MSCTRKTLGVGLVGYGFMGKVHTYAYKTIPFYYDSPPCNVKLVGICDTIDNNRSKAIEQAGYAFQTKNYVDLLKRDDIQIINCCLPNFMHKEIIIASLKAGKHVYCDKPLALNLTEAKEIYDVSKKSRLKTQMALEYRYIPAIMRAKQLIEEGFLGDILSFRTVYLHSSCVTQKKTYSWKAEFGKVGGGVLVDLGSHIIDLLLFLLGDFKKVSGTLRNFTSKDKRTDDLAIVTIEMANGAIGILEASKMATGANDEFRIEIHGSKGAMRFNSMDPNWLEVYDNTEVANPIGGKKGFKKIETVQRYQEAPGIPMPKFSIGWIRYHVACLYSFLDAIANNKKPSPDFEDGLKLQKIMDAVMQSSKSNGWKDVN